MNIILIVFIILIFVFILIFSTMNANISSTVVNSDTVPIPLTDTKIRPGITHKPTQKNITKITQKPVQLISTQKITEKVVASESVKLPSKNGLVNITCTSVGPYNYPACKNSDSGKSGYMECAYQDTTCLKKLHSQNPNAVIGQYFATGTANQFPNSGITTLKNSNQCAGDYPKYGGCIDYTKSNNVKAMTELGKKIIDSCVNSGICSAIRLDQSDSCDVSDKSYAEKCQQGMNQVLTNMSIYAKEKNLSHGIIPNNGYNTVQGVPGVSEILYKLDKNGQGIALTGQMYDGCSKDFSAAKPALARSAPGVPILNMNAC